MPQSILPVFKQKLDEFLSTIPDEPICQGYTDIPRVKPKSHQIKLFFLEHDNLWEASLAVSSDRVVIGHLLRFVQAYQTKNYCCAPMTSLSRYWAFLKEYWPIVVVNFLVTGNMG